MGKFSLERKIKDRLQGHEVHIDKRELWKSLGIEEEEKDRKGIWYWWLGGIIGLAFIGGMWWYIQSDNMEAPNVQEFSSVEIDDNIAKTGNETSDENATVEQLASIIDEVESQNNEAIKTTNQNSRNSNLNSNSKQNRNNTNSNQTQENTLVTQRSLANESKTIDNSTNKTNKELSNHIGNNIGSESVNLNKELFIDRLQSVTSFLFFDRDLGDLYVDAKPFIKPLPKPRKFEFEFFGGVGTNNRTLSSEFEDHLLRRDTSESTLEQVSLGISLKYIIGGGFYGKAGLSINRWNEQYTYNLVSDTTETTVDVPDVILIDLSGNSTTQFTGGIQTIYNTIDWVRYNRLTQIDLPITIGYEHRISRWSLFGEASGIFNLKQKFNGYLNTEEGIETQNPDIFKSSIGFNLGLNAGIGYGFTPRLRARLSARYYRSLGSVLLQSTEVEQKYSSIGARVGIGYLF